MPAATALAANFASGPTAAFAGTQVFDARGSHERPLSHLDSEAEEQRKAGRSNDYAEGVGLF